jgi:hypothetical protein
MLIPATLRPIPKTDLARRTRSQFASRVVVPPDRPNKPVWRAALVPVWQIVGEFTTMLGDEAVGGVLSITVLLDTVALVTVSVAAAGSA